MSAVRGTGAVTADGCPVEVYRGLPALGEPGLVHSWAGPGASVLDLGAGAGRIADPLVDLGHDVLAVDDSADMLAHVRRARIHQAEITGLDLEERFGVVLLASHLVNTPDDGLRHGLLAAAGRHLSPTGRLLAQWHPPAWFDGLRTGEVHDGQVGAADSRFTVAALADGLLTGEVTYTIDGASWRHPFRARRLAFVDLDAALARAGLQRVELTPSDPDWFGAVRA
ncbi:class I SAM-dependent methyltransferase [Modestobacter sp. SYSU DS0290]